MFHDKLILTCTYSPITFEFVYSDNRKSKSDYLHDEETGGQETRDESFAIPWCYQLIEDNTYNITRLKIRIQYIALDNIPFPVAITKTSIARTVLVARKHLWLHKLRLERPSREQHKLTDIRTVVRTKGIKYELLITYPKIRMYIER